jgi:hypothetical protein
VTGNGARQDRGCQHEGNEGDERSFSGNGLAAVRQTDVRHQLVPPSIQSGMQGLTPVTAV